MKERREHGRFERELPVHISPLGQDSPMIVGRTRDVSAWGIYVNVHEVLAAGTKIQCEILVPRGPDSESHHLRVTGVVLRVGRSDEGPGMAILFNQAVAEFAS